MCNKHYLSQHDLAILHRFAREQGIGAEVRDPSGRKLAALLASSLPLPETDAAPRHVSLGATVHYRSDGARELSSIVIACPYDANALLARVTILSPLALGLLGHAEGCSVEIELPNARSMLVDIVGVDAPARIPPPAPYHPVCNPPERRSP
ncbi:GreA/GreB family elongation factor [Massilia sp. UBA6681]|uniref:GreA/GreB family elongation factor n=1 Tax=Massilia sp. UBA6681 TaxID=1946839 RepID=UPI0025BF73FA|nr:GreA/GreB family elongation factor [Massilia sp. UBA6681]